MNPELYHSALERPPLEGGDEALGVSGLSASRDGKVLVWAQIDHQDSDLMLIDNFR